MFATLILSTAPFLFLLAGMAVVALVAIGALLLQFPILIPLVVIYAVCLKVGTAGQGNRGQNADAGPAANHLKHAESAFHNRLQKTQLPLWWSALTWTPKSAHRTSVAKKSVSLGRV